MLKPAILISASGVRLAVPLKVGEKFGKGRFHKASVTMLRYRSGEFIPEAEQTALLRQYSLLLYYAGMRQYSHALN